MEPSTPVLPTQVTPPELALSDAAPHAIVGVEVVAVPVLPGDDDTGPALGPGAEELSEQLGVDLLALLEAEKATGKVGEVVRFPVPLGGRFVVHGSTLWEDEAMRRPRVPLDSIVALDVGQMRIQRIDQFLRRPLIGFSTTKIQLRFNAVSITMRRVFGFGA